MKLMSVPASGKITKLYVKLGQEIKKAKWSLILILPPKLTNTKKAALVSYQAQLKAKKTAYDVALQAITAYQSFIRKSDFFR